MAGIVSQSEMKMACRIRPGFPSTTVWRTLTACGWATTRHDWPSRVLAGPCRYHLQRTFGAGHSKARAHQSALLMSPALGRGRRSFRSEPAALGWLVRHREQFAALRPASPFPAAVVSEAPDAGPALLEFLDRHRKQLVQLFERPVEIAEVAIRAVHVVLLDQTSAPSQKTLRFGPLRAQSRRTHAAGFSCSWVPPSPEDWLASGRPGTESLATCSFGLLGSRWLGRWDAMYQKILIEAISKDTLLEQKKAARHQWMLKQRLLSTCFARKERRCLPRATCYGQASKPLESGTARARVRLHTAPRDRPQLRCALLQKLPALGGWRCSEARLRNDGTLLFGRR